MARTFNRAYDQADRMLNTSGLSSIVYRVSGGDIGDAGDFIGGYTDYEAGVQQESSGDIPRYHDPAYGKTSQGTPVIEKQHLRHTGADTRPKGPPSSRMYKDWRNPNFLYDRYEKDAVERNKLYDSTYGGMKPKTPFTNTGYKGRLGYGGVPTHVGSDWVAISDEDAKYMTGVQEFAGNKFVTRDTWEFMQGQEAIKADERERQEGYAKADKSLEADEKKHREIAQEIKDKNLMEKFLKDPNLYLMNRSATGGKVMPGGLSGINKTININGQPHSLAWINPGEASALRNMGGSGKKVDGIPAYFGVGGWGTEDVGTGMLDDIGGEYVDIADRDPYTYESPTPTVIPAASDSDDTQVDIGLPWLADKNVPAATQSYNLVGDLPKKGFLGLTGDRMNMSEAIEGAYKSGFTKWRGGIGMYEADAGKAYNEWFSKQNPEDLVKGYKIGDPVGYSTRSAMNRISEQLKNKFKDARDLGSVGQEDEEPYKMTRKDYQESAKGIEGIEDFTPYDGSLPVWMPAWMQAIVGFASRTVIGTGKVGGVGVHIHEDGTITAVSPEDSPGYDHAAQHESGSDVPFRYRSKPVRQASVSETVEEKPTGMAALLARRSTPALGQAALQPQIDTLVSSGIPLEEALKMLNINV